MHQEKLPPLVSAENFEDVKVFGSDGDNTAFGYETYPNVRVEDLLVDEPMYPYESHPNLWREVLTRDSWLYLTFRLAERHGWDGDAPKHVREHNRLYNEFFSDRSNSTALARMNYELMKLWTGESSYQLYQSEIEEIVDEIPVRNYVKDTLELAANLNIRTALFTSSYDIYGRRLGKRAGFQEVYYNPMLTIDIVTKRFLGFATQPNDPEYKRHQVEDFFRTNSLKPVEFLYTGDGYTDIGVMQIQGIKGVMYGTRNEELAKLAVARVDSFYELYSILKASNQFLAQRRAV